MTTRVAISPSDRYYILARDAFTCQYCGRSAPDVALHVDHIVPVAHGGENDPLNLLATCESCNTSKGTHLLPEAVKAELEEGIRRRSETYARTQSEAPESATTERHPDVVKRPQHLLRAHKAIVIEPLKGRRIHPDKQHVLLCAFDGEGDMTMSYHRRNRQSWETHPVVFRGEPKASPSVWRPLPYAESLTLINSLEFESVDQLCEGGRDVTIHKSKENIHLIQMTDHNTHRQTHYLFWVPLKTIELAIDVNTDDESTYTDEDIH